MFQEEFFAASKQQTVRGPMSLLPYMPFVPAWIEQSSAFVHPDPGVAVAAMRLIFAAWRGVPAGHIPASHAFLASATGRSVEFVGKYYGVLTEGFELGEDGLLRHLGLSRICSQIEERYAKEVEAYSLSVVMSAQDGDAFGSVSTETAPRKGRGKTAIPKGFGFDTCTEDLRGWCETHGYIGPEDQDYVMEKFVDYSKGRDERNKDWAAAFRTFATNEITRFRRYPPNYWDSHTQTRSTSTNSFAGLARGSVSRGDQVAMRNMERMARMSAQPPV